MPVGDSNTPIPPWRSVAYNERISSSWICRTARAGTRGRSCSRWRRTTRNEARRCRSRDLKWTRPGRRATPRGERRRGARARRAPRRYPWPPRPRNRRRRTPERLPAGRHGAANTAHGFFKARGSREAVCRETLSVFLRPNETKTTVMKNTLYEEERTVQKRGLDTHDSLARSRERH